MSFSTRFFKRKATAPAFKDFDKSTVTTALPPAPVPQDSTRVQPDGNAPTTNATTDDAINAESGKSTTDTRQTVNLQAPAQKTTVKDNTAKTGTSTGSTFSQPSLFQAFWNEETSHVLDPDVLEDKNQWTPNALAMFEILSQTRTLSADHRDITKRFPQYLDYATMIYYCYLFYIQILRARRSANILTGEESRVLRRFERDFKPESLPIAGPLVPFFTSLVSTQLDDEQFSWVAPRIIPQFYATGRTLATPYTDNGQLYLQPALPHLVSILAFAIAPQMNQAELTLAHATGDLVHWNDEDNFVPYNYTATQAARLWNINFNRDPATVLAAHDRLFSASGMTYPFVSDVQSLLSARKSWMNSTFNQVRTIPCLFGVARTTAAPGYTSDGSTSLHGLDNFLLMPKNESSTFFEKLIENAAIHARCFKGNQNLSQIPTVGGSETLVLSTLQLKTALPANYNYATYDVDITVNNKVTWYRNPFVNLRATFSTMIANPPRAEVLQAFTFGINSTLPIVGMFDARTANDHTAFTAPHDQRFGPIWTHSVRKMEYRDEAGQQGKEMFKYFGRVIHSNLWNERL